MINITKTSTPDFIFCVNTMSSVGDTHVSETPAGNHIPVPTDPTELAAFQQKYTMYSVGPYPYKIQPINVRLTARGEMDAFAEGVHMTCPRGYVAWDLMTPSDILITATQPDTVALCTINASKPWKATSFTLANNETRTIVPTPDEYLVLGDGVANVNGHVHTGPEIYKLSTNDIVIEGLDNALFFTLKPVVL
jgi:hypothetical protein